MEQVISVQSCSWKRSGHSDPASGQQSHRLLPGYAGNFAQIEVVFGNPAKDCLHIGICRIHLSARKSMAPKPSCGCGVTAFIKTWERKGVELFFSKKTLPEAIIQKHFANDCFRVETAYRLPDDVADAIESNGITIQPGAYPILEEQDFFSIVFA